METSGYAKGAQGVDRACTKSRPQSHTKEATATVFLPGQLRGHQEGAGKTTRSRVHQRGLPSQVAGQPYPRPKEEQQRVEDVRRLHRSKQALPKGSFWATPH